MEVTRRAECSECEFAVYCFTEQSQWVFRTKKDIEEIRKAIEACPVRPLIAMRYEKDGGRSFVRNGKS